MSSVLQMLERQLGPDMLLLCDAGICCSQVLFTARSIGAHVVGRLDSCSYKVPWVRLQDGRYLVKVYQNSRNRCGKVLTARVMEYQREAIPGLAN